MRNHYTMKIAGALALIVTLTACGGGGSSAVQSSPAPVPAPAPAPSPAPAPTPAPAPGADNSPVAGAFPSTGNLVPVAPAPTYAIGSQQLSAFNALNQLRVGAGAGALTQSLSIDVAAQKHADYVAANPATTHYQTPGTPLFYGQTPGERMALAGYPGLWTNEVLGGTGASMNAADCVRGLLNTVYHAAAMLSNYFDVGIGIAKDPLGVPLCVIDFGHTSAWTAGQTPASGKLVAYPFDRQTDVEYVSYLGYEVPRISASLVPTLTAGTPVIVSMRNADFVNAQGTLQLAPKIKTFQISGPSGVVPSVIVANPAIVSAGVQLNADSQLTEGIAVLVPLAPLAPNTTYTVTFDGSVTTKGNRLNSTWSFTTAK